MFIKLASTSLAIPILNNQFYVGTSLLNVMIFGKDEWGVGVLPIRVGYWQTIIADELTVEPFLEYNYYPSSFFNLGGRINLRVFDNINLSMILGFASGSTDFEFTSGPLKDLGYATDFSRAYLGFSLNLGRIFYPQELRYNKEK